LNAHLPPLRLEFEMNQLPHPWIRQALIGLVCIAVLLGVLSMYLQPEFLLTLANQVWGCF
jgi:hypothetical protein